ncbi:uncharacterized protein LOC107975788 [Pan troglodytes]|uniref:uncharacterized protein LOC107975788 n=1 Tax=Pan troglodytes TaxID=9598 RepID=UPI0030138A08
MEKLAHCTPLRAPRNTRPPHPGPSSQPPADHSSRTPPRTLTFLPFLPSSSISPRAAPAARPARPGSPAASSRYMLDPGPPPPRSRRRPPAGPEVSAPAAPRTRTSGPERAGPHSAPPRPHLPQRRPRPRLSLILTFRPKGIGPAAIRPRPFRENTARWPRSRREHRPQAEDPAPSGRPRTRLPCTTPTPPRVLQESRKRSYPLFASARPRERTCPAPCSLRPLSARGSARGSSSNFFNLPPSLRRPTSQPASRPGRRSSDEVRGMR